jgi:PBSX family phage portal protein
MALTKVSKKAKPESPKMFFIQKVIKNDTYMVLADSQLEQEDAFVGMYYTMEDSSKVFLEPPFSPKFLQRQISLNNTLGQCIDALEVNIDGTGYTLQPTDQNQEIDKGEESTLTSFFGEPYPGKSFTTIRRLLRRDLEAVGWGFLEFLRSASGELVSVRNVLTSATRMVKLDKPVPVTKIITRNGKDVQITYMERERRFAQKLMNTVTYFREYGSTRQLDKVTGEWEAPGKPVALANRASELMMFTVNPDTDSMYGLPHWINNLPSVLGSRKAEEQNLEFFDAGGVPPSIVFVQGGTLAAGMADQLRTYLSGQMKAKNRAVVVEAVSNSGSLEGAAGSVQVRVERFGSEKMQDPLYKSYDDATADHVRTSFRLPTLFLGKSTDYNFATAQVAYMVAEAQVFQPEREEFDEIINKTVLKEFGIKTCKFKSNPITLKDVEQQLAGMTLGQQYAKKEEFIEEINKIAGVSLQFDQEAADQAKVQSNFSMGLDKNGNPLPPPEPKPAEKPASGSKVVPIKPGQKPAPSKVPPTAQKVAKSDSTLDGLRLVNMAKAYGQATGFLVTKFDMSESDAQEIKEQFNALDEDIQDGVLEILSELTMNAVEPDMIGVLTGHEH